MFQATQAHKWMNDAHVHEMQVQMWNLNTWGVTWLLAFLSVITKCGGFNSIPGNGARNACWYLLTCHFVLVVT